MYLITSTPQQVISNIQKFPRELHSSPELQNRLAYARAWYAYRDAKGRWSFGPSKFVGYEGMDADAYLASAEDRDGRRTEAQLQKWFTAVDPSTELYTQLNSELVAFLAKYNKTPSTKIRISVPNEVYEEYAGHEGVNPNDTIVDLIVAVAASRPASHRENLRARLNK